MSLNTTFAAGDVLTAADMNGLQAAWTSYTPTWTGSSGSPAIGNGVLTGRYLRIGKTFHIRIVMTAGATTTVGSGTYTFALPAAAHGTGEQALSADFYDGAAHYATTGLIAPGSSVVSPFSTKGGASGAQIQLGSTSFAAGVSAIVAIQGTYEAA